MRDRRFFCYRRTLALRPRKLHWDLSDLAEGSVGVLSAGKGDLTLTGPPTIFDEQWFLAGPAVRVEDAKTHFSAYGLGTPGFRYEDDARMGRLGLRLPHTDVSLS